MAEVRLIDLDVIKRYSLAIRQETAPAEELLAVLDASRDIVMAALPTRRGTTTKTRPAKAAKKVARKQS